MEEPAPKRARLSIEEVMLELDHEDDDGPLTVGSDWRAQRAYLVVQLARFLSLYIYMIPMMHFGPETAHAQQANVTGLASSARHQCVAFN